MEQLRLLPKFFLVALLFVLPLTAVTGLLFSELAKSIAFAKQEQNGLRYMAATDALLSLLQQHRAMRHMSINGNAALQAPIAQTHNAIAQRFNELDNAREGLRQIGLDDALTMIKKHWLTLQSGTASQSKASYAEHSALIVQLQKFKSAVADRTNLRLDPETNTHYLALALLDTIPALNENVMTIAGRGASYIDTGLLEAN